MTTLALACYHRKLDIVKYLIEEAGADPELSGSEETLPLVLVFEHKQFEFGPTSPIIRFLVETVQVSFKKQLWMQLMKKYSTSFYTLFFSFENMEIMLAYGLEKGYIKINDVVDYEAVTPELAVLVIDRKVNWFEWALENNVQGWCYAHDLILRLRREGIEDDVCLDFLRSVFSSETTIDINAVDASGRSFLWKIIDGSIFWFSLNPDLNYSRPLTPQFFQCLSEELGARIELDQNFALYKICSMPPFGDDEERCEIFPFIVRYLIETLGADPNAITKDGDLPLIATSRMCKDNCFELLREYGASADKALQYGMNYILTGNDPYDDMEPPLDLIKELVERGGPSLEGTIKDVGHSVGQADQWHPSYPSPLYMACSHDSRNLEVIEYLLEKGALVAAEKSNAIKYLQDNPENDEDSEMLSTLQSHHRTQIWNLLQDLNGKYSSWCPSLCLSRSNAASCKRKHE